VTRTARSAYASTHFGPQQRTPGRSYTSPAPTNITVTAGRISRAWRSARLTQSKTNGLVIPLPR
jgi:hypothetical protein